VLFRSFYIVLKNEVLKKSSVYGLMESFMNFSILK
jgi:hypothetical protein